MGMYDEIVCNYPLPNCSVKNFQTKDLENMLINYFITEEGRLIEEVYDYEEVPEEERPYYGTEAWENSPVTAIFGCLRRKNRREVDTNYHGDILIYTIGANNEWIEFKIRFTDGNVSKVEKINNDT